MSVGGEVSEGGAGREMNVLFGPGRTMDGQMDNGHCDYRTSIDLFFLTADRNILSICDMIRGRTFISRLEHSPLSDPRKENEEGVLVWRM
uniref:Uncharacterized protein n=1 Tax=Knipowitschia caucasica TaxID=637954 RepID=A0AAV2LIB2_KNICA